MKRSTIDGLTKERRVDSRRDAEVGRRVRSKRLERCWSLTELADRIGVTFQQVQKYEKGHNRISAGRLQRISEAFEVPISFFFDAAPDAAARSRSRGSGSVFGLMQTAGSMRLMEAFHKIKSRKWRLLLVGIAEELVNA